MELGGDRELRFQVDHWSPFLNGLLGLVSLAAAVPVLVLPATVLLARVWGTGGVPPGPAVACALMGIGLVLALWGTVSGYALVRGVLLLRRGRVVLTRVGVLACDWRGRQERLFWPEIDGLYTGLDKDRLACDAVFELRSGKRRVVIDGSVQDKRHLIAAIVQHSGLTEQRPRRWGTLYTRPTG
ncbi:MAG: hypothetical protein FJX75_00815 [Armatimonadetes bacterium]|nr:hypothetical protein [Armatimonadota bacterium]